MKAAPEKIVPVQHSWQLPSLQPGASAMNS